jgi:hypothetical protein
LRQHGLREEQRRGAQQEHGHESGRAAHVAAKLDGQQEGHQQGRGRHQQHGERVCSGEYPARVQKAARYAITPGGCTLGTVECGIQARRKPP